MGVSLEGAAYTEFSQSVEDLARSLGYVVDVKTDIPIGFNVYGGFRFHPNVAVEAEFEMMPGSDVKEFGLTAAEIETWAFTGNAKIFFLSDQMQQPFLLVGIGVLHAELKDTMGLGLTESADDFGARFGGGVDHYFTENVALSVRVTYVLATGSVDVFDYVSFGAGLQYRF
jgi:opacity protein-like surface antigen